MLNNLLKSLFADHEGLTVHQPVQGPAINFTIDYQTQGESNIKMDIDFTAIICAKLPFRGYTNWPESQTWNNNSRDPCRWPSVEQVNEVLAAGINLVAKIYCHCKSASHIAKRFFLNQWKGMVYGRKFIASLKAFVKKSANSLSLGHTITIEPGSQLYPPICSRYTSNNEY